MTVLDYLVLTLCVYPIIGGIMGWMFGVLRLEFKSIPAILLAVGIYIGSYFAILRMVDWNR